MNIEEVVQSGRLDFSDIPANYYLLGLLSAFENRFQALADSVMQEISWKQFFAIICINMCKEAPTIKELSEVLGSSHQNVKQILLKLEKKNFVRFQSDEADKRKQRIVLTNECREFCEKNASFSSVFFCNRDGNLYADSDLHHTDYRQGNHSCNPQEACRTARNHAADPGRGTRGRRAASGGVRRRKRSAPNPHRTSTNTAR